MLMNPAGVGNNITVVYEAKTTMYEEMTLTDFNTQFKPVYEAMGMTISSPSINQLKNENGLKITKIKMTTTVASVTMTQTMYVTTVGDRTYSITVTETTSDADLVKNVFDTLSIVK